jgi:hypothetical protein
MSVSHGSNPKLPIGSNRCQCGGCDRYFASVAAFDKHRREGGCLTEAEMLGRGMSVNDKGYWVTQAWSEQIPLGKDAARW